MILTLINITTKKELIEKEFTEQQIIFFLTFKGQSCLSEI